MSDAETPPEPASSDSSPSDSSPSDAPAVVAASPSAAPESTASPFEAFGLDPRMLKALADLGFKDPTDIQLAALPVLLTGRDVVARARTGSGKTAAFALPLIERIKDSPPGVRALVLAPTRELAMQVSEAIRTYSIGMNVHGVTIYGGAPYGPQLKALHQGVPIVVGTPGRLIDHLERGNLDLSGVEFVVLDEADEMLRMGFIEDVEKLLAAMPDDRQVALFSATMPAPIRRMASKYLHDPVTIQVEDGGPAVDHIEQAFAVVPQRAKEDALLRAIAGGDRGTTLVFSRTRRSCAEVSEALSNAGFSVDALHGDLNQTAREQVLRKLRAGQVEIVVATDIAARGIDVEHITQVINLDLPENAEVYVHRIGRTGRAGRAGRALTFVSPAEMGRFSRFGRELGQPVSEVTLPSDAAIARKGRESLRQGINRGLERDLDAVRAWLAEVVADGKLTIEDVAAAAIAVIAAEKGVTMDADLSDDPPHYGHRPRVEPRYERGPERHERPAAPRTERPPLRTERAPAARPAERPAPVRSEPAPAPREERPVAPLRNERPPPLRDERPPVRRDERSAHEYGAPPSFDPGERAAPKRRPEPPTDRPATARAPSPPPRPSPPRQDDRGPERPRTTPFGVSEPVELFLPVGTSVGIRPGDLVGAITNEAGIPGHLIGKVTVLENKSFVGVPPDVADHILRQVPRLEIRGRLVPISRSHGRGAPSSDPPTGGGHSPYFNKKKGPPRR